MNFKSFFSLKNDLEFEGFFVCLFVCKWALSSGSYLHLEQIHNPVQLGPECMREKACSQGPPLNLSVSASRVAAQGPKPKN